MQMFLEKEEGEDIIVLTFSNDEPEAMAQAIASTVEAIPGVGASVERTCNPRRGMARWKVVIYFF